jgi:bifunctional non-homologous end joining protein LigD
MTKIQRRRPSGFIEPCLPSKVARPPSGPSWVQEIKHDGYRLMVRRDGARVRCFTHNGMTGPTAFPPSWTLVSIPPNYSG